MEFIRNTQQRNSSGTSNLIGVIHRNQILNHVILAEINLFQKDKVNDLKLYMKSLLDEQIEFYEKVKIFFFQFYFFFLIYRFIKNKKITTTNEMIIFFMKYFENQVNDQMVINDEKFLMMLTFD